MLKYTKTKFIKNKLNCNKLIAKKKKLNIVIDPFNDILKSILTLLLKMLTALLYKGPASSFNQYNNNKVKKKKRNGQEGTYNVVTYLLFTTQRMSPFILHFTQFYFIRYL